MTNKQVYEAGKVGNTEWTVYADGDFAIKHPGASWDEWESELFVDNNHAGSFFTAIEEVKVARLKAYTARDARRSRERCNTSKVRKQVT